MGRSSRRRPAPREIELGTERDNREGLTLMRPAEEVTLGPNTRFVCMPGEKGKGWVLKVFTDPDEKPDKPKPEAAQAPADG